MYTHADHTQMKVARLYLRVSSSTQDWSRQKVLEQNARAAGYYVAGVYAEKASGARADRPELLRMIGDLQNDDVIIAESVDRITRLPLADSEKLVATIRSKGAKLSVPGLVDLSELAAESDGISKIVLESVQELLLKLALQMAREDYETRRERQRQGICLAKAAGRYVGRAPDIAAHKRIVALRSAGQTISKTAELAGCSVSQAKRIWAIHQAIPKVLNQNNLPAFSSLGNPPSLLPASLLVRERDLARASAGEPQTRLAKALVISRETTLCVPRVTAP